MQNHALAGVEAGADLSLQAVVLADLDFPQLGATVALDEDRPRVALAEQGRQGRAQHVGGLPEHDSRLDPVAVAKALPSFTWSGDVDHHVDALFLDAEGGHLGEAERLYALHHAVERLIATPCVDDDALPGLDPHGV